LHWEYRWRADGLTLCVAAQPSPRGVTLWRASAATRDFRDSTWAGEPSQRDDTGYAASVSRPSDGYVGVFAEAQFDGGGKPYSLSTNLAILAAHADDDGAAKPLGEPGVCARK
jgi:hypothetical protein